MEKFEIIEQVGEGSFATVIRAKDLKTGDLVAIKKLKKKYTNWQECVELREVKSLDILKKHDNIIKLKEMIRVDDTLHLVFEHMEKNLYEMMDQRQTKKFNESQIKCVMWQTLQGLAYMHKYGFFHRDLKPENLLVNGDSLKIADFGLAREIRSLPPYTDYVSTRYYRAPECILRSTNYNSPVDIWAVACIMIEMYNYKPIFAGTTEKEVLFRICSVLGTPTNTTWPEGIQYSKKIDFKFPNSSGIPFSQVIPDASKEALEFIGEMLKWDPNKRCTASVLLQHPYFTKYPIPNKLSNPEYSNKEIIGKSVKSYSNKPIKSNNTDKNKNSEILDNQKIENEFNNLFNDTKGFNDFIKKMKDKKMEEEREFLESNKDKNTKVDNEFDFNAPNYFKDSNKLLYQNNNSIFSSNNSGVGSTSLTNYGSNSQNNQSQSIYNYGKNKNAFDTTTLNNSNGSRHGNNRSGSYGSNDIETLIDLPPSKENLGIEENIQMNRRKNLVDELNGLVENVSNELRERENKKAQTIDNESSNFNNNSKGAEKKEIDFDNCNIYLKDNTANNLTSSNRPASRKRSAFKFIEETLDKGTANTNINTNSFNSKIPGQFNSNQPINQISTTSTVNPQTEKKPEYQSRRRNPMNILNDLDNPNLLEINLNNNQTIKEQVDNPNIFRKNNSNLNNDIVRENNRLNKNSKNMNVEQTDNIVGFGLRRHVTNHNPYNNMLNNNMNSNKSKPPLNKDSSIRDKYLII